MAARHWRKFKPNHGWEGPEFVIVVDSETVPLGDEPDHHYWNNFQKFRLGVAVAWRRRGGKWTGEDWLEFTDTGRFWSWLLQWNAKKSHAWVFAHNWHYDAQALGLWSMLDAGVLKLTLPAKEPYIGRTGKRVDPKPWKGLCAIESSPFVLVAATARGIFKFVDTTNYVPASLEKCGQTLGLEKLPRPRFSAPDADWMTYCRRDVEITAGVVKGLIDSWHGGQRGTWQPTAGRLALSNYRHAHLYPGLTSHGDEEAQKLERAAYIGGEIRNWYRGEAEGPAHLVDMGGFYASIMRDEDLPFGLVRRIEGESSSRFLAAVNPAHCIARVRIDTGFADFPCRIGERTRWPVGSFWTTLCGRELEAAVLQGAVTDCDEVALYKVGPIFRSYANYWIEERMKAQAANDGVADTLAKVMLVSLYGKFGAMTNRWEIVPGFRPKDKWGYWYGFHPTTGKVAKWRAVGGSAQVEGEREERDDTLVAIPAFVCAAGRKRMRDARAYLPVNSCFLQSTDSLLLTDRGLAAIMETPAWGPGQCGKFRHIDTFRHIEVLSANCWIGDKTEKLAGVGGNRRLLGPWEWAVHKPSSSVDVVGRGPKPGVDWKEVTVKLQADTGDIGHWHHGWSEGAASFDSMKQLEAESAEFADVLVF